MRDPSRRVCRSVRHFRVTIQPSSLNRIRGFAEPLRQVPPRAPHGPRRWCIHYWEGLLRWSRFLRYAANAAWTGNSRTIRTTITLSITHHPVVEHEDHPVISRKKAARHHDVIQKSANPTQTATFFISGIPLKRHKPWLGSWTTLQLGPQGDYCARLR